MDKLTIDRFQEDCFVMRCASRNTVVRNLNWYSFSISDIPNILHNNFFLYVNMTKFHSIMSLSGLQYKFIMLLSTIKINEIAMIRTGSTVTVPPFWICSLNRGITGRF